MKMHGETVKKLLLWFYCSRSYWRSQCYGGISACCASVRYPL